MKGFSKSFVFGAALFVGISAVAAQEIAKLDATSSPPPANLDAGFALEEAAEPEMAMYSLDPEAVPAEEDVERSVEAMVQVVHELISKDPEAHDKLEIIAISMPGKMSGLVEELLHKENGPTDQVNEPSEENPAELPTDDVQTVTDFVIGQYAGRWYEQGSTIETQVFTEGCECTQATYTLVESKSHRRARSLRGKSHMGRPDKYLQVKNECYRSDKHRGYNGITGSATPVSPVVNEDPLTLEDARLQVQFFGRPSIPDADCEGNYHVVAVTTKIVDGLTVYDNAIVMGPQDSNMIWFLTRDRQISDEAFEDLRNAAIAAGISCELLKETEFTRTAQYTECDELVSRDRKRDH